MNINVILREIFTGVGGTLSSKRLVTFISTLMIVTAFVADLFFDLTVDQFVFDGIMYIVVAGLGFTGAERFVKGSSE